MEQKNPLNPYSPSYRFPENPHQSFLPTENHQQNPLVQHHSMESAFSRLTLSPSLTRTPALPENLDEASSSTESAVTLPMAYGERQQPLFWAQSSSNTDANNGLLGFPGAHQISNVGPETVSYFGAGPHPAQGELINLNPRRDVCGDYSSLYGKKPLPREASIQFPFLSRGEQINYGVSRSSMPFSNQSPALEGTKGRIAALATDPMGSAFLSMKLEEGLGQDEIQSIILEVLEYFGDLLRNQFGSNFLQKLFVSCSDDQRTRIIMAITRVPSKLIGICLNAQGTRGVQNLLEKLIPPEIPLMVSALSRGVLTLANDQNGQHVLHYCIKHFPREYNKYFFSEIADKCFEVATNKSGCCVLQSCVENSDGEDRKELLSKIEANALRLAEDPYGNYVVQHLLSLRLPEVEENLLRQYEGYFASLSCNKYASNVVEKFLSESKTNNSAKVIMELLTGPDAAMLLIHPYGNFVIQSALSVAKEHIRDSLVCLIQDNLASMQSNIYGRKILERFDKKRVRQRQRRNT